MLYTDRMKPQPVLTFPTVKLIDEAAAKFDRQSEAAEEALKELFSSYPTNDNLNHVLWKVILLNRIYSTQVLAVEDLARHIVERAVELDHLIQIGAPEAVDLFSNVTLGKRQFNLFSFASKYCSWHNQRTYPIFDTRVGWYLWNLQKRTKFCELFTRYEFQNYKEYKTIFLAFQRYFQLETYDFKTLDKFLWLYGEPSVPKQKEENQLARAMEPEPVLIIDGVRSDESLHADMLDNEPANLLADENARQIARELGFTEERIAEMIRPPGRR